MSRVGFGQHAYGKVAIFIAALCVLWGFAPSSAWALDPSRDVSKYGHAVLRNLDGFGPGTIGPIAQTSDGYLWLGTPSGLLRFDGVKSIPWRMPSGSALPDDRVRTLLGMRDGALFIGTFRGLARLKDGQLHAFVGLKGSVINALAQGSDGTVWVGGSVRDKGFLCNIPQGSVICNVTDIGAHGAVAGLASDRSGDIWVAADREVWRVQSANASSYRLDTRIGALQIIAATPDGGIVVGTFGAVVKLIDGHAHTMPLPLSASGFLITKILCDRDGSLWIAVADAGLLHLHDGRTDTYTAADGLSGDHVLGMFEDREGNIWASTSHGLDRFQPMAAAIYSRGDGINGRVASVLAARDGILWVTTTKAAYRLDGDRVTEVRSSRSATLFEDHEGRVWFASEHDFGYFERGRFIPKAGMPPGPVDGIADDSQGNVWFANRDAGLLRLRPDGGIDRTPWAKFGKFDAVSTMVVDPKDDSLWLGFWSGAIANVRDGVVRSLRQLQARPNTSGAGITQLRFDADGALWIASRSALGRLQGNRLSLLDTASGMPCDGAFWTSVDARSTWIYTTCGLVEIARADMIAWSAAVDRGVSKKLDPRLLNQSQGVGQPSNVSAVGQIDRVQLFAPKIARTTDGRIWFVTGDGLVALDPDHIPYNNTPPPVHVEQVVADGTEWPAQPGLRLPPLQRDLRFDYTGLSFTAADQVNFRYRLDGHDRDWQDAGSRRQVFYPNLAPGLYRFRVIAANASGVWNREGDSLEFLVEPAWWQTSSFRVACAVAVLLLFCALYKLRIAQLSQQFNTSFEARVSERLRIARELHDTLLQSFQGLVLRLQTALQLWPNDSGHGILEEGIELAANAITEGRNAVQGLRSAATEGSDLAGSIRALGQALATNPQLAVVRLSVEVQGRARTLHPVVRDDVFRIVAEALRNAYLHAEPKRVEVDIRYNDRALSVLVRDDGKGMDRGMTRRGRNGHFGLHGMRERSRLIGATLTISSRPGAGTEVDLSVPNARAYAVNAEPGGNFIQVTGKTPDIAEA